MTDPSEVKISDAEITAFYEHFQDRNGSRVEAVAIRDALAAFLAQRLPRAFGEMQDTLGATYEAHGFNACRARVLAGPE